MSDRDKRKKKRKALWLQRVEYVLVRILLTPLHMASVPRVRRWGAAFGSLGFRLARARTRLAVRNVRTTFPEKNDAECRAIVRACWQHFISDVFVYLRTLDQSVETVLERIIPIHAERLDQAIAIGRGVILYSAHFGSWEIGASILPRFSSRWMLVARPLDNDLLQKELYAGRTRIGVEVVPKRAAARGMLRTLQAGGGVVLLPDQSVKPEEGILVPFLGRPAWTTPAPARMAIRLDCPIVGVFCIPDGEEIRVEFVEAILPSALAEEQRTPEWITGRINDAISEQILERPSLWLWMHDRWKNTESAAEKASHPGPR